MDDIYNGWKKRIVEDVDLIYKKEKKIKEEERKLISLVCLPFEPLRWFTFSWKAYKHGLWDRPPS